MWYAVFYYAMVIASRIRFWYRCKGIENIPDGAVVFCANHSSNWDIAFIAAALGRRAALKFTPKISLKRIPILGWLMDRVNVVWIDRAKSSDPTPIRKLLRLLEAGERVVLFPEGKRVSAGESEQAKTGAVLLASKSGAPVVPVYIPREKTRLRRFDIVFGTPFVVTASGSNERRAAAEQIMSRIDEAGTVSLE